MVVFVSLQVVPHGSFRSLLVLGLWLGGARGVEELVIPFLRSLSRFCFSLLSWSAMLSKVDWGVSAVACFS